MPHEFEIEEHDKLLLELDAEAERLLALYRARYPGAGPEQEFPLLFGKSGDDHVRWLRRFLKPLR